MKSRLQVDWQKTRIAASKYAHANDVFAKLELGDAPPRYLVDDVLTGFEEPAREHRDRVEGRNRKPHRSYGTCAGRIVAFDSLDGQPVGVLADFVEKHLRGGELNRHQLGYAVGLHHYLSDKTSISECNPVTVRALLKGIAG